jgi:membrane associated rhomboid family serine protease
MIIPFLDGFLKFSKAPITWLIILLNAFMFSQNYSLSSQCSEEFEAWYKDRDFLYTQGQIYRQFNQKRSLAKIQDSEMIGRLAFRDEDFLAKAPNKEWSGDQVAIQSWRDDIQGFLVVRAYYPSFLFGVSQSNFDFFSTISYQFYHEGFLHFLGNVLLILIIGGYLERRYSGFMVFSVYIIGGSLAAYFFSFVAGLNGSPLVGASGSLCALLGVLLAFEFQHKTRLFYLILPTRKHSGFVFVPTLYWVILFCMLEDITGLLAQPAALSSSIAHWVHLLGFFVGIAMGLVLKRLFFQPRVPHSSFNF